MFIISAASPPFHKNGFVVSSESTGEAVVIDPGDEVEELIGAIQTRKLHIRYILLTHAHLDHITGVGRAKAVFDVPVYLHEADLPLYEAVVQQGMMFGLHVQPQPRPDRFYGPDDTIRFGSCEVRVHHTPGHSPGGICLQIGESGAAGQDLFVGDTLFAGSIGRTDLPGGDYDTLIRSIRSVLFAFEDDARVYPGHGEPTTIGRERRGNPFLQG